MRRAKLRAGADLRGTAEGHYHNAVLKPYRSGSRCRCDRRKGPTVRRESQRLAERAVHVTVQARKEQAHATHVAEAVDTQPVQFLVTRTVRQREHAYASGIVQRGASAGCRCENGSLMLTPP